MLSIVGIEKRFGEALLVNADPTLMPQTQLKQVCTVLATAYCRGVPS